MMASQGLMEARIIPKPRISHLTTGSEIIPADRPARLGEIRNSNKFLISALLQKQGMEPPLHRHASEDIDECLFAINKGKLDQSDILLVSGGSSVGGHDHTEELLSRLGFEIQVRRVAYRPGRPLILGFQQGRVAVGMPGNPVSHFVTFHLVVSRILRLLSGRPATEFLEGVLSDEERLLESSVLETLWPAIWSVAAGKVIVTPKPWLNSGHLAALAGVNALIRLPAGSPLPETGTSVKFLPCSYS
jgi:molybdopterin molybdotransferase